MRKMEKNILVTSSGRLVQNVTQEKNNNINKEVLMKRLFTILLTLISFNVLGGSYVQSVSIMTNLEIISSKCIFKHTDENRTFTNFLKRARAKSKLCRVSYRLLEVQCHYGPYVGRTTTYKTLEDCKEGARINLKQAEKLVIEKMQQL